MNAFRRLFIFKGGDAYPETFAMMSMGGVMPPCFASSLSAYPAARRGPRSLQGWDLFRDGRSARRPERENIPALVKRVREQEKP